MWTGFLKSPPLTGTSRNSHVSYAPRLGAPCGAITGHLLCPRGLHVTQARESDRARPVSRSRRFSAQHQEHTRVFDLFSIGKTRPLTFSLSPQVTRADSPSTGVHTAGSEQPPSQYLVEADTSDEESARALGAASCHSQRSSWAASESQVPWLGRAPSGSFYEGGAFSLQHPVIAEKPGFPCFKATRSHKPT